MAQVIQAVMIRPIRNTTTITALNLLTSFII
jgi:hypothetical protein